MRANIVLTGVAIAIATYGAVFAFDHSALAATGMPAARSAVLVELFTSEGCSSCPPADALLETLDRSGSADKPETIVLSEHVDYWNHIGWADPYSSRFISDRQRAYASRLRLDSVYTPQMVVDGTVEFVGNDKNSAKSAIAKAAQSEKTTVRLVAIDDGNVQPQRVRVEVDPLPPSLQARDAGVYLAVASNEATSQVLRGENGGRRLHHVAVLRSLTSIGEFHGGTQFSKEVPVAARHGESWSGLRLVAFVQERGPGRVLGAAMLAGRANTR